jgi:hypothetical protein
MASSRWRPFAWFAATAVVLGISAAAFSPGPIRGLEPLNNPLGLEGAPDVVVGLRSIFERLYNNFRSSIDAPSSVQRVLPRK